MVKDLCSKCAAIMQEHYRVKKVGGGVDCKVTCSKCNKRRYGGTYSVELKKQQ